MDESLKRNPYGPLFPRWAKGQSLAKMVELVNGRLRRHTVVLGRRPLWKTSVNVYEWNNTRAEFVRCLCLGSKRQCLIYLVGMLDSAIID